MAGIVESARAALRPLIAGQVVTGVRLAGLADVDGILRPILSVGVAGDRPEAHAHEISRLIQAAGLDVEWSMTTPEDAPWPRARHIHP